MKSALLDIAASFPPADQAVTGETIEIRARAVLSTLRLAAPSPAPGEERGVGGRGSDNPTVCPNCLSPYTSERSPYCSIQCREEAAFVRQFRSSVLDQSLKDPHKQVALGQKFWHLIGGGYPLRQTLAPASALKQLYKRTNNRCEICGAPAITFDHTGSG